MSFHLYRYPLTWFLLVLIEMQDGAAHGLDTFPKALYAVTVQAPVLMPYGRDLRWMVPVTFAVLCIPFYLVSVAAELLVAKAVFSKTFLETAAALDDRGECVELWDTNRFSNGMGSGEFAVLR